MSDKITLPVQLRKGRDSYAMIHRFARANLPQPKQCSDCGTEEGKIEAANISGLYKRDIGDFKWLCCKCHKAFDEMGVRTKLRATNKWNTLQYCKQGHALKDNLYRYIMKNGHQYTECKTCNKERTYIRRARMKNG